MILSNISGETRRKDLAIAAFALLLVAFVAGGASQRNELRLAVTELAALPLLVIALGELTRSANRVSPLALGITVALIALPLLQLIPLPIALWAGLPGRDQAALALDIAGARPSWVPLSLAPEETWRSFLALVPPVAMLCGVMVGAPTFRLRTVQLLLVLLAGSLIIAGLQALLGGQALRIWPTTTTGTIVGLFANRNHLATLCVLSLPFAAVIAGRALRHAGAGKVTFWLSIALIGSTILALAVIRSRMGLMLLVPCLGASLLAAWISTGRGRPGQLYLGLIGGVVAAVTAAAIIALPPLLERFDSSGPKEGRFENWPTVLEAAGAHLPLGSGLGSFDAVYRSVEPLVRLDETYFNQAHNDYLETWLEAGWPGAILIAAFLVWFTRRTWTAWRGKNCTARDLQMAASIAIGVVLLHSFVDYPLRTETIAVIFAICCGLLETAAWREQHSGSDQPAGRRRRRAG